MSYTCVVFDMDGTVLNTLTDLEIALNHSLRLSDFPERTTDEVRRLIGNGVRMLIRRAAPPDITEEQHEKLFSDFQQWYMVHCSDNTRPYEGITSAVSELRSAGVVTAVVSNKIDGAVKELCKVFFDGLFEAQIGMTDKSRLKPAPDAVLKALETLATEKSRAVYIGDTEVDMQTAENSGLDFIGVGWGYRGEEFLRGQGAKNVARVPSDLLSLVTGF